jgi:hypothetical protein
MMKKESFDDLMTQQRSLQHLDDLDSLMKRLELLEKAHLHSIKTSQFMLAFATLIFIFVAYTFLSVPQPSIKNQVGLFISIVMFVFSLRLLTKGYAILKTVRKVKEEIGKSKAGS